MFESELVQISTTNHAEYSLFHAGSGRWITIGDDGGIRFAADEPVSLTTFYESPDVGAEDFAFQMLDWLREQAGTGEVIQDRYVDINPADLAAAGVCRFRGRRPVMIETGLEFNHDFRSRDIVFEVRGPVSLVDDYIGKYAREFPPSRFQTTFSVQGSQHGNKTVRVMRRVSHPAL